MSLGGAGGFITHKFKDASTLYSCYMPFVKGGGVFIPSSREFKIGEEVFLALSFLEDPQKYGVTGRIVWVAPRGGQSGKTAGAGVQFLEDEQGAKAYIEQLLTGALESNRPTFTL